MTSPTFIEILRSEVARMQTLHPERLGELARAHALILHGQVLPSADDPQTGQVLSSDGEKRYTVNGVCSCQAGQHGKGCKHMQAWRLYRYIAGKVEAPCASTLPAPAALPEAPASVNVRLMIDGRDCQLTLRDADEARLLQRLQAVLAQYPTPQPQAPASSQGQDEPPPCKYHGAMKASTKAPGTFFCTRKLADGSYCPSRFPAH